MVNKANVERWRALDIVIYEGTGDYGTHVSREMADALTEAAHVIDELLTARGNSAEARASAYLAEWRGGDAK